MEQVDQPEAAPLLDIRVDPNAPLRERWESALLGGVMTVGVQGTVFDPEAWHDQLYRPLAPAGLPQRPVGLTAIPYYAWANRGRHPMRVWLPRAQIQEHGEEYESKRYFNSK